MARPVADLVDLDDLKRPIYLAGLLIGLPIIALVLWLRWGDVVSRVSYLLLLVVLSGLAVGLRRRTLGVDTAERVVLVAVPVLWLGRLAALVVAGAELDAIRDTVTESIAPGLVVIVLLLYLANDARTGLRFGAWLAGAFGALLVPVLVRAFAAGGDSGAGVAVVRMLVWVLVVTLLAYVLAHLKERLAQARRRADEFDLLASTDPVTGIANRRRAETVLADRLEEAERYDRPLGLALLDLDGFKAVNDAAGHAAGDRALRSVVRALAGDLRGVDTLARWGGDELVVIAPETTLEALEASADRWRRKVAELGIRGGATILTVSAGVTVRRPGDTVASFLDRADGALYAAKGDGRDRTVAVG